MAGHRWALCAPITNDGKAVAFLYVTHDEVAFSSQEEKLAEYLVSLAGAALDGLRAARQRRKALEALRLKRRPIRRFVSFGWSGPRASRR